MVSRNRVINKLQFYEVIKTKQIILLLHFRRFKKKLFASKNVPKLVEIHPSQKQEIVLTNI